MEVLNNLVISSSLILLFFKIVASLTAQSLEPINMIYQLSLIALSFLIFFSCNNKGIVTTETTTPNEIRLSDLAEIDQIDSVLMDNNYGKHFISADKLEAFKSKLGAMLLEEGSYKMGGIGFTVYIKGKGYHFSGRTHGTLIETTRDIVTKPGLKGKEKWLYFKTDGLNLDNY